MSDMPLTSFGEVLTAQLKPEAGWRFDYGINQKIVKVTTANGGAVTQDANRAKLSTGVNPAGLARIETLKRLRYFPGMGGVMRFTAVFGTPRAQVVQYAGLGDTSDRLFFGFRGLEFGVGRRRGGVDYFTPATQFRYTNDLDWNPGAGNVYQLRFQWLGYGYQRFFMLDFESEDAGFRRLHTINYPNTSADVHILNPTLPCFAEVVNSGSTADTVLYTPSAAAFSEGITGPVFNPLDIYNAFDATATISDQNNNHLASIRNMTTLAGNTNRVPVQVNRLTVSRGSGAALSRIRLYRGAAFGGAITYAQVDAGNSPVEASSSAATILTVAAEKAYALPASTAPLVINFAPGELVLQPGEALTVGCQNTGPQATEVVCTLDWSELF